MKPQPNTRVRPQTPREDGKRENEGVAPVLGFGGDTYRDGKAGEGIDFKGKIESLFHSRKV